MLDMPNNYINGDKTFNILEYYRGERFQLYVIRRNFWALDITTTVHFEISLDHSRLFHVR